VALNSIAASGAIRSALDRIAEAAGEARRPATSSRYTVRTVDGPATWEGGELIRGGGPDGTSTWRAVTTGVVAAGGSLIIEAVETGPIRLTTPQTLDVVDAVPGTTELIWESGTDPDGQIGRTVESDGELRARLKTVSALRRALLNGTSWVLAVSTAVTPGANMEVSIAPAPVGADQEAELARILGERSLGLTLSGSSSVTWEAPGGQTVTIPYTVASTVDVTVAVTVTGTGIDTSAVESAVLVYGQARTADDNVIVRAKLFGAVASVQGVTDVTVLTIDGSAANYTPSTGVLALLTVDVTVAT